MGGRGTTGDKVSNIYARGRLREIQLVPTLVQQLTKIYTDTARRAVPLR